ncbi:methionine/alanine import family NSS transporter small subunit [Sediminibacillus albus]|uniref:Putative methionine and alanine importer, small subunit n=1 Tax=Sediminibacillus albus TaxID=407036 RepID=A0A1G8YXK5_9BACI|nr:methionine/alanine import family NSS transporter small subunit [Sediminibacillus albus]SDK07533.1 Putative methionine and alanine importer, small subunit [Sediminibacillus albus]
MTGGAITMAIIGIVVIWGGLISSIVYARKAAKAKS